MHQQNSTAINDVSHLPLTIKTIFNDLQNTEKTKPSDLIDKNSESSIFPLVTSIVNFSKNEYLFVSKSTLQIFGKTSQSIVNNGMLQEKSLFSEAHKEIYATEIIPLILKWYNIVSSKKDLTRTRLSLNISMLDKSGSTFPTTHIFKPYWLDEKGIPTLTTKYIYNNSFVSDDLPPAMVLEYLNYKNEWVLLLKKVFQPKFMRTSILSTREKEILELLEKGYGSKEIAFKLMISLNTVNNHIKNISKKVGKDIVPMK